MMDTHKFYGVFRVGGNKLQAKNLGSKSYVHEWHNNRKSERAAPSADPDAPRPKVIFGGNKGLKAAIEKVLEDHDVTPATKTTVVAAEIIVSASSGYFVDGTTGEKGYKFWNKKKVRNWRKAAISMLKKTFGSRLAMLIYHADETAPHIHAYVVPICKHVAVIGWSPNGRRRRLENGQAKVGGRDYFTRRNLIEWQDAYGAEIESIGLHRGERGSKAKHKKMRDAQRDLEKQGSQLKQEKNRLVELNSLINEEIGAAEWEKQNAIQKQKTLDRETNDQRFERDMLKSDRLEFLKDRKKLDEEAAALAQERDNLKIEKKQIDDGKAEIRNALARLRSIPIRSLAEKMGFTVDEDGNFSVRLMIEPVKDNIEFTYRALMTEEKFSVETFRHVRSGNYEWVKQGGGKGAIDFMKALKPKWLISEICDHLATLFPDHKEGIYLELLARQKPALWEDIIPRKQAAEKEAASPTKNADDGIDKPI